MSDDVKQIYSGPLGTLGYCDEGKYKGWVFTKNFDGRWVTLAKIPEAAEIVALKAELAEWEASKSHIIDIIHDSTAPFLARAEAAERELAEVRGKVENWISEHEVRYGLSETDKNKLRK